MGPYLSAAFFATRHAAPFLVGPVLTAIAQSAAKLAARKFIETYVEGPQYDYFEKPERFELWPSSASLLSSESADSFMSTATEMDPSTDTIIDPEEDRDNILTFIASLDAVSDANETGWTYANAIRALDTDKFRDLTNFERERTKRAKFDFFSHFDPVLRAHLRRSYSRWGFTGEAPLRWRLDFPGTTAPPLQDLVRSIGSAIEAPARGSREKSLRKKNKARTEEENEMMGTNRMGFEPTWNGVVDSRIDDVMQVHVPPAESRGRPLNSRWHLLQ